MPTATAPSASAALLTGSPTRACYGSRWANASSSSSLRTGVSFMPCSSTGEVSVCGTWVPPRRPRARPPCFSSRSVDSQSGEAQRRAFKAAARLLERTCRRLEALLVQPLVRDIADRDLVIIPTGPLHAVPWALLPGLRGPTVTTSPSAALWYSRESEACSTGASDATGDVVLVAGPGVAEAEKEIIRIRAAWHKRARVLRGAGATTASVTRLLEGCRVVHVAAHGRFRADNPQFSSLELVDGPVTVYDLEAIARPPQWMVLSACDAGRRGGAPG